MTRLPRGATLLTLAAVVLCSSACGTDSAPAESASATASASATEEESTAIDACALIAPEDITALLGVPVAGKSTTTDPRLPGCFWENPDNLESVSLEIGSPGTAVNGTLPSPEPGFPDLTTPGPDGMRFITDGAVEFAAGGRSNTVQVAVLRMLGGDADAAAVDLARKVGPQIPQ